MVKSKFTPEQKIQIVLESIKTGISTAELCHKYNVYPQTFNEWRKKFIESGKAALSVHGTKKILSKPRKRKKLENHRRADNSQRHFKKNLGGKQRLNVARQLHEKMSLRRSLSMAGISKRMRYYKPSLRDIALDPVVTHAMQETGSKRPIWNASYGSSNNTILELPQIARKYREYSKN